MNERVVAAVDSRHATLKVAARDGGRHPVALEFGREWVFVSREHAIMLRDAVTGTAAVNVAVAASEPEQRAPASVSVAGPAGDEVLLSAIGTKVMQTRQVGRDSLREALQTVIDALPAEPESVDMDAKTIEELIEALTAYLALPAKEQFHLNPELSLLARSVLARDRGEIVLEAIEGRKPRPVIEELAANWGVGREQMFKLAQAARARRNQEGRGE